MEVALMSRQYRPCATAAPTVFYAHQSMLPRGSGTLAEADDDAKRMEEEGALEAGSCVRTPAPSEVFSVIQKVIALVRGQLVFEVSLLMITGRAGHQRSSLRGYLNLSEGLGMRNRHWWNYWDSTAVKSRALNLLN